jgi:hypothetical protein
MGRLARVPRRTPGVPVRTQDRVSSTSPGRHIGATGRVSAQNLSKMAQQLGRCGAINEITGYVCVTQPHDDDVEHMSMFIGGPRDGQVTSRWGGRKQNTGVIPTKKVVPDA